VKGSRRATGSRRPPTALPHHPAAAASAPLAMAEESKLDVSADMPANPQPPVVGLSRSMEGLDLDPLTRMDEQAIRDLLNELEKDGLEPSFVEDPSAASPGAGDHEDPQDAVPPMADRSASLVRADAAVDLNRLRLEVNFSSHGMDDGDIVVIKSRKIDVDVIMTTDQDQLAVKQQLQLDIAISYESGLPVDELANTTADGPLFQVLGTRHPWIIDGKAKFEVKINVLSSMRNMQKFKLQVFPLDETIRASHANLRCSTTAIKTLSKMPRRKSLGTDAASRAARREEERRRLEAEQKSQLVAQLGEGAAAILDGESSAGAGGSSGGYQGALFAAAAAAPTAIAGAAAGGAANQAGNTELRAMVQEQEARIAQLTADNRRMMEEVRALRAHYQEAASGGATTPAPSDGVQRQRTDGD